MYLKELDTTKSLPHLHRVKGFKYIFERSFAERKYTKRSILYSKEENEDSFIPLNDRM